MPKLIVCTGDQKGLVHRLSDQKTTIGRDPSNQIVLSDRRVSRTHACISQEGEGFVIEDLHSINGTELNKRHISREILSYGDEIIVGSTVIAYVSLEAPDEVDPGGSLSQVRLLSSRESPSDMTVMARLSPDQVKSPQYDLSQSPDVKAAYQRLMVLYQVSHELSRLVDVDALLKRILQLVLEISKAEHGAILLKDGESGQLNVRSVAHQEESVPGEIVISQTISQEVMATGESVLLNDASSDARFRSSDSVVQQGICSSICVPLKVKNDTIGILYIDSRHNSGGFSPGDLELVTSVANQASVAIENARLFDHLRKANQDLKEQQHQLIESEKLSALGRLAGGVAHEINNPLTSILGFSQMVRERFASPALSSEELAECAEHMRIIEEETQRCGQIVQSLLQFSRRKKNVMARVDVNQVIDVTLTIARFHVKRAPIQIKKELRADLPSITGDASQLQQVFLNMVINARDAMDKGGVLVISTDVEDDQWVVIRFSDTGCGIPADKLNDIFKPLYTTKEEGKGTGLGLSVSQDIVELHQGVIDVESTVGAGTTFTIRLPLEQKPVSASR